MICESIVTFVDFTCHSCDKTFKHKSSLSRHARIAHKDQTADATKTPVHSFNVRDDSVSR